MKMNNIRITFLYKMIISIIFSLTVLPLVGSPVYAEHDPMKNLDGPAFTDPSQILEMTPEWEKQPIKYDPSAGNAETVTLVLEPGKNTLVLSIDGERTDAHTATEKDRLVFNVG